MFELEAIETENIEPVEELIDDQLGNTGDEVWHIKDDNTADWAIEKIRALKAEYARKEKVAQAKIRQIQDWLEQQKRRGDSSIAFFEGKLREYFETLNEKALKKSKTQLSYSLPAGKLILKQQQPKFIIDDTKLLEWLKQSGKSKFIRVKEEPDWASLKKFATVIADKIVDENGEIVDGVKVVEQAPKFVIEINEGD
ncbi:Mu-like prophage host-nuclease inhibitor protein Gam [Caldanaerobius fijiensis DSM 17918]|uniref:Mu-like prophage host-nuclease inhibitor protein Gam n=1 Tax=Caldanaerobius fijiensis DSM 17918 TaxID=1121256 RepID=A0A1M5EAN3_9THEO|nr:host-nuclease inhibitor Gam family protein [Caldanaerobius fijiensis]SHF76323.1 Mu-like prophage host-nuclease inhibitor protein Gam [Caldanaerobius fijiensis DSM 17918]